jgi:pantetheine-phosphate adenylyltransferase
MRLLEKALEIAEKITVGLTTDEMVSRMYKNHEVEAYLTRLSKLKSFLRERAVLGRIEIIPLEDSFGPTVLEDDFDAVVVSRETLPGADRINEIRDSKGMVPLDIVVIDMVLDEDAVPISSTRIRQGIIDRWGRLKVRDNSSS